MKRFRQWGLEFISLLLCSGFLHVYPSTTNKTPKPWQHNTRKMNSLPDDHENCFCYPEGQLPTVQQLLDFQNNGQERLVIYLYKNSVTNEIKMYTPNANKQMLIPDLPYEAGDGLVLVTTENLYTLLNNNPYKIKVYNDNVQTLVPAVTESFAIGLNTGAIENVYPNADNHLNPNNFYKGNEYNLAPNVVLVKGPSATVLNEPQKGSTKYSNNAVPEQYDINLSPEQYWMGNNYPYTKPDDPLAIPLKPQVNDAQALPLNLPTVPNNTHIILEDPLALPDLQSSPHKLQATALDALSALPNPQAVPQNQQVDSGNIQAVPGNPQAIPGIIPGNPKAFPNSYIGGLDQYVVYSFPSDQGVNKQPPGSQDINNPLSAQYVTFHVWFDQQMKRFQNINLPNEIKTIDSDTLKILVQKTFYENNIYISSDGLLTDSKGIVIDAANLELRPLLLGEKLNHQILQNVRKVIKLPKHLPYLEGILVTLISPPQILGIIPLGKTYLPETSYMASALSGLATVNGSKIYVNSIGTSTQMPYTMAYKEIYPGPTNYYAYSGVNKVPISRNSNSEPYKKALAVADPYSGRNQKPQLGINEPTYWSSGPYQTGSQLPYPTANWNPSEILQYYGLRRKNSDAKIEHHYEAPKKSKQKESLRKKLTEEKEDVSREVTTVEPFPSINGTESGRRFPTPSLKSVMKTLLYLLDDLPSRRGLNTTEELDESKSNNDDETPDFRIIGGNAATGSGTPLSNKGRSGGPEYA